MSRLRWSEWLAAGGAVALVVCMFALYWHQGEPSRGGWQALPVVRWIVLVTVAVVIVTVLAQALARGPGLPVALDVVALVPSVVTVIALAIALGTTPQTLCPGAFVDLGLAIVMLLGVFACLRIEGGWRPGRDRAVKVVWLEPPARD